jgi:hypothetical protein
VTTTEEDRAGMKAWIHSKIDVVGSCWIWTASKDRHGYGLARHALGVLAHRVSYRIFVGEIPPGLCIDHKCRSRACVNPEHLETVTNRENLMRGNTKAAIFSARTHCARGHEFTQENTHIRPRGNGRQCRTCMLEDNRRYGASFRERKRAANAERRP